MTYQELENHLLSAMDSADSRQSKLNISFTKEKAWNLFMQVCIDKNDKTQNVDSLILKNVLSEFPDYSEFKNQTS